MQRISTAQKHSILRNMRENEFHKKLKVLFERMFPDKTTLIGQGTGEFGKDLVIIEKDELSGEKVTALVVKMGNLSGSASNGLVGTINTQINQAFNVPTYFKDLGREVTADSVIVMIAGTIANNAKQTLNGYLNSYAKFNIQTKNIEDLTKLFEDYYDEVFHISDEAEDLEKKYRDLEETLNSKHKHISRCYVEPNLKSFEKTTEQLIVAQQVGKLSDNTITDTMFGKRVKIEGLLQIITEHKNFVLIEGEAGSGKSIFSTKLIQQAIDKKIKTFTDITVDQEIKVPVLLKSTKLKNNTKEEFDEKIKKYYNDYHSNIKPNALIIDGLDEVNTTERDYIIELSENYCNDNKISLVYTTRKDQDIVNKLERYKRFELLPFEYSQAIEFIKRMAGKNEELINGLLNNLQELQHQIPMTPMSLSLLVEIAEKHKEIPASISELYNRYIDMVMGVDNTNNEISQLFVPRYKIHFLLSVSYELFFQKNVSSVSKEEFEEYLENYVSKHSHINSKEDFFQDLKRISILNINCQTISFSHKSFLDYFIAKYFYDNTEEIMDKGEFEILYELYYTSLWEDVTNFYFGLKDKITKQQIDKLLNANIYKETDSLLYNLELYSIGRLLQYAWNTDKDIKKYGISESTKNILEFREILGEFNKKHFNLTLPKIVSDATIMQFTDTNYTSIFLRNEILEMMEEHINMIKDRDNQIDLSDRIYFYSIFILVNNKKLELVEIEKFLENLIELKGHVNPNIYFPITALYNVYVQKSNVNISTENKRKLDKIFKTLSKKYTAIHEETLLFKNKVESRKFRSIAR